jgi:hypothetical protein
MTDQSLSEGLRSSPASPLDLEPIRQRVKLAQRMFGVSFDGYPDMDREPVDIQRDQDRSALLRELERVRAEVSSPARPQPPELNKTPTGSCLVCGHIKTFAVFTNGSFDPLYPRWVGVCEDCRNAPARLAEVSSAPPPALREIVEDLRHAARIGSAEGLRLRMEEAADQLAALASSSSQEPT